MKHLTFLCVACSLWMIGCGQTPAVFDGDRNNEPSTANHSEPTVIKLGMSKDTVSMLLKTFGANDISSGMQATADAPKSNWMWSTASPKLSIETLFDDSKLATINVWDWRNRKMTSYHHTMKYDQVDSLSLNGDGTFGANVIKTFNEAAD